MFHVSTNEIKTLNACGWSNRLYVRGGGVNGGINIKASLVKNITGVRVLVGMDGRGEGRRQRSLMMVLVEN